MCASASVISLYSSLAQQLVCGKVVKKYEKKIYSDQINPKNTKSNSCNVDIFNSVTLANDNVNAIFRGKVAIQATHDI